MKLKKFVLEEVDNYEYTYSEECIGNAMPSSWVEDQLVEAKKCVVDPYLQKMWLQDTYEQLEDKKNRIEEDLWVVAEDEKFKIFYDPKNKEFGLSQICLDPQPVTIGIRGDFVGCFMAR